EPNLGVQARLPSPQLARRCIRYLTRSRMKVLGGDRTPIIGDPRQPKVEEKSSPESLGSNLGRHVERVVERHDESDLWPDVNNFAVAGESDDLLEPRHRIVSKLRL